MQTSDRSQHQRRPNDLAMDGSTIGSSPIRDTDFFSLFFFVFLFSFVARMSVWSVVYQSKDVYVASAHWTEDMTLDSLEGMRNWPGRRGYSLPLYCIPLRD